jgi:hypothetical protein
MNRTLVKRLTLMLAAVLVPPAAATPQDGWRGNGSGGGRAVPPDGELA